MFAVSERFAADQATVTIASGRRSTSSRDAISDPITDSMAFPALFFLGENVAEKVA
ncbi:hypothetical protein M422DRAFT_28859 [Sphaerobolus stellatus SS14]|nr:hypothetical protein M422DRAFT_28859 [Sphaerobolus stellatus SS14]